MSMTLPVKKDYHFFHRRFVPAEGENLTIPACISAIIPDKKFDHVHLFNLFALLGVSYKVFKQFIQSNPGFPEHLHHALSAQEFPSYPAAFTFQFDKALLAPFMLARMEFFHPVLPISVIIRFFFVGLFEFAK